MLVFADSLKLGWMNVNCDHNIAGVMTANKKKKKGDGYYD